MRDDEHDAWIPEPAPSQLGQLRLLEFELGPAHRTSSAPPAADHVVLGQKRAVLRSTTGKDDTQRRTTRARLLLRRHFLTLGRVRGTRAESARRFIGAAR
jgi:hypothetical protein